MYIIAEVGINANGDVKIAKELINMAYGCGANAVKFQKRQIDTVYTREFLAEPRESPWGSTQGDQKHGLEFGWDEYDEIDRHCRTLGIDWFGSAWDMESLYFLDQYTPKYHKIASPMLTNKEFLNMVAGLKRPVILSTGMSTTQQILDAVQIFRDAKIKTIVMHCVSIYPCPDEDCNIRQVEHLAGMLPDCEVGYSGHERGIQPTLAAIALGATYIERHITLDRTMYGSDQSASIERRGLCRIVEYAKQIGQCLGKAGRIEVHPKELESAAKLRYWEAS
jgi:N-acetylneuraminate synthase